MILIKLNKIKPRHVKTTIIQVKTINIMWMGNIEYEEDKLMLVDEKGDDPVIPKLR